MKQLTASSLAGTLALPATATAQGYDRPYHRVEPPDDDSLVGMMQTHFMARTYEILAERVSTRSNGRRPIGVSSTAPMPR